MLEGSTITLVASLFLLERGVLYLTILLFVFFCRRDFNYFNFCVFYSTDSWSCLWHVYTLDCYNGIFFIIFFCYYQLLAFNIRQGFTLSKIILASLVVLRFLLLLVLTAVQLVLAESRLLTEAQYSSVESGFDKLWYSMFSRSPFFFLAVLFVLFDIELILVLPVVIKSHLILILFSIVLALVLAVITITLMFEWLWSGLKWQI